MNCDSRPTLIMVCLALVGMTSSAFAVVYVVKEKDTLSGIAKKYFKRPIWGTKGGVQKILDQNPQIKDRDLIFPGAVITLTPEAPAAEHELAKDLETSAPEASPSESQSAPATPVASEVSHGASRALLELTPGFSATTLYAKSLTTGGDSQLASQMHFSLTGKYFQDWSQHFKTHFSLSFGYIAFEEPSDPGTSISEGTKFLSGFGLGADYRLNSDLTLSLLARYQKELFIKFVSTTSAGVDAVMIPSISAKAMYDVFELKQYIFGVAGEAALLLPGATESYAIRLGTMLGGIIYIRHQKQDTHEERFTVEFGVSQRTQDTSLFEESEGKVFLQVRLPIGVR